MHGNSLNPIISEFQDHNWKEVLSSLLLILNDWRINVSPKVQYHHHHNDNIKLLLIIIAMQYTVHVTVDCQLRWIVYAC